MKSYIVKKIYHYCNVSLQNCSAIPEHIIDYYDFTFVIKGSMTYIANGETFILRENDAIMLKPGTLRQRKSGNSPIKYVSFNFIPFDEKMMIYEPFMKNIISEEIKRIISFFSLRHITSSYYSEEKLMNILNYILLELLNIIDFKSSNPHIIKIIKYINNHINEPVSLSSVSKHINLSKEYIANIFKKETGKTVCEYINERKMLLAKDMIQYHNYSLNQISESLGYENYSYFSRVFKKFFGTSPKEMEKIR